MSKILKIALKEINLIRSQKIAMFMVLLYPIIIISVLLLALGGPSFFGSALGTTGIEKITVAAYVPESSLTFDYETFYRKIDETRNLNIIVFNSKENLKKSITLGESDIGIVLEEPKNASDSLKANIIFDNISIYLSSSLTLLAESKIREIANETSKESLSKIWSKLQSIQLQLVSERKKIDDFCMT